MFFALSYVFFLPFHLFAKARVPEPSERVEKYSLTEAKPVPIPAKKAALPLPVYGEEPTISMSFIPSGYMGDTTALKVTAIDESAPLPSGRKGKNALKVTYAPRGGAGWVGLYWQSPANNWAKIKGAGFNLSKAERLTFWTKGEKGGEKIVEFKVGGIVGPYPDTDGASLGPVELSDQWEQYTIDLKGKDLRHIIGGFAFILRESDNPRGATFYLDEIVFYGPPADSMQASPISSTSSVPSSNVASSTGAAPVTEPLRHVLAFDNAKAALVEPGRERLAEIGRAVAGCKACAVLIEGHTDDIGSDEVNKRLSLQRAQFVADYLQSLGVDKNRLNVKGYGEERPLAPDSNKTPEGRRKNRRVEITVMPEKEL